MTRSLPAALPVDRPSAARPGTAPAGGTAATKLGRSQRRLRPLRPKNTRQLRFALGLAVLAALSAALVLLYQSTHGIKMVFMDSVTYVSVARNLLQGEGFVRWNGRLFGAVWPPGYPLLLALASWGGGNPVAVAGPFNAMLHGATVFAAGHWLRDRIASRFLAFWGCLALACAAPLLHAATTIMSEPAFVLCVTLAFIQLDHCLARGRRRRLAAAAACAGLAALTRYAGLPLIAAGTALLALQPGIRPRIRAGRASAFALAALAPLGVWLYRNYRVTGSFTHMDDFVPSGRTLSENAGAALETLASWALFAPVNDVKAEGGALLALAALLTLAGLGLFLWRRDTGARRGYAALLLCAAFVLAYGAFIVVATLSHHVPAPSTRFLVPTYVPLLFAFVFVADKARLQLRARRNTRLARALPCLLKALLLAWIGSGLFLSLYTSLFPQRTRSSLHWAASPTMRYMRTHLATGWIFSNLAHHAYMQATRRVQHRWLPGSLDDLAPWLEAQLQRADDAYVIFFHGLHHDPEQPYRFSAADLRALAQLEPIAALTDGVVFRVASRDAQVRDDFDALTAATPVLEDVFRVYRAAGALHFVKAPCAWDDTELKFVLHAVPLRRRDLPPARQALGFANLDFPFSRYGLRVDDRCLATVPLPAYALARLRVGQFASAAPLGRGVAWQADIPGPILSPAAGQALRADWAAATAGVPSARAVFDVYATPDAVRFAKRPCRPADTQPKFILHALPVRRWRLPWHRRGPTFENLDFAFADWDGVLFEDRCWVRVPLPSYPLDRIRVGQFDSVNQRALWQKTLPLRSPATRRAGNRG